MSSEESDDIPLEQMQHHLNSSSANEDHYEPDEDEDEPQLSHQANRLNGKLKMRETDDSLDADMEENYNDDENSEDDYEPEDNDAADQTAHHSIQHHAQNNPDDEDAVEEDEIELEFEDNDQPQLLYQDTNGLEQEQSDEDDIPLSVRKAAAVNVKQEGNLQVAHRSNGHLKHEAKEEQELDTSDFDDDVPLASIRNIVAKRAAAKAAASIGQKQTMRKKVRKTLINKKSSIAKKVRTTAVKVEKGKAKKPPKSPVKRVPKLKKEEEVSGRKFEAPGQRRETPPDTDPARLFYQSMYNEKVSKGKQSPIAEQWMLRHGLLDIRVAEKLLSRLKSK